MKYDIQWDIKAFTEIGAKKRESSCRIQIKEPNWIDWISFTIEYDVRTKSTNHVIKIGPSKEYIIPNGYVYTNSETRFPIARWFENITKKVKHIILGYIEMSDLTQTEFLHCTKEILNHLTFSSEDTAKLLHFTEQGILSEQQILEKITLLVHTFKHQEAFDLAMECNNKGYPGILYTLGGIFLVNQYIQPAYIVFSNVPQDDSNYLNAQMHAARQAALPDITFSSERERCRTVFNHCQNAGEPGRPIILHFFKNIIGPETTQHYLLEQVDTDFDTLFNFATVMSQQGSKITQQQREIKELKEKLAQYETPKTSYDPRHFSTSNNNSGFAPGASDDINLIK